MRYTPLKLSYFHKINNFGYQEQTNKKEEKKRKKYFWNTDEVYFLASKWGIPLWSCFFQDLVCSQNIKKVLLTDRESGDYI